MAKIERDNFDLPTLCMKGEIIGAEIALEDGSFEEIVDWYQDTSTMELHLTFKDGSVSTFNGKDKYTVKIKETYKKVKKGNRKKKPKKKK